MCILKYVSCSIVTCYLNQKAQENNLFLKGVLVWEPILADTIQFGILLDIIYECEGCASMRANFGFNWGVEKGIMDNNKFN